MEQKKNQLVAYDLRSFNNMLTGENTQKYLRQVLGKNAQSFVNNMTALVANSRNLQQCDPLTLLYAGIKATALNLPLDPNLGFAYVIPYNNNKAGKVEAQFQIGYKGLVRLAINSGQFLNMNVTEIKEGELIGYNLLTGDIQFEAQPNREQLKTIGYAAYFKLTNGFSKTLYMTTEEMEAHAKRYSQTYGSKYDNIRTQSKWATDFDIMAKKTALKSILSHWAPLSIEMQEGIKADQAVIHQDRIEYVDNLQGDTYQEVEQEMQQEANSQELPPTEETEQQAAPESKPAPATSRRATRKGPDF